MRFVNPIGSPFEFSHFVDENENILSVILPTFGDLVFLSPETELCPSLYRNAERVDLTFNTIIGLHIFLRRVTQETPFPEIDLAWWEDTGRFNAPISQAVH